jgi:signal transduction histidine kinase
MVTHDVRTPLQTVTTFLEFMETAELQPEVRASLEKTLADAEHLAQRINDLLKAEKEQDAGKLLTAGLAPAMPSE